MTFYMIEPDHRSLHGAFSRELAPILTIDPGDTVRFRTLDADWNLEPRRSTVYHERPRQFEPRPPGQEQGHALCGPVAIRGAQPGMTLAVHIEAVQPSGWGFTAVGGWPHPVNERLGIASEGTYLLWTLDAATSRGQDQYGHIVALRPFMGVLGMPPDRPGLHSTIPPRVTGGNLDCKELVAGSTLYLPIAVPAGSFRPATGTRCKAMARHA
jgi:acetamidase/formamidase